MPIFLKSDELIDLLVGKPKGVFTEQIAFVVKFLEDVRYMDTKWEYLQAHIVANTCEVVDPTHIAVLAAGQSNQRRLLVEKTAGELACINECL